MIGQMTPEETDAAKIMVLTMCNKLEKLAAVCRASGKHQPLRKLLNTLEGSLLSFSDDVVGPLRTAAAAQREAFGWPAALEPISSHTLELGNEREARMTVIAPPRMRKAMQEQAREVQ